MPRGIDPGWGVPLPCSWIGLRRQGRCQISQRAQEAQGRRTVVRCAAVVAVAGIVMLFTAGRVEAAPSVQAECTPAPVDCSGWYRQDVRLHWIVLPSTATVTGCQDKLFDKDTPGTREYCRAQ